MLSRDFIGLRIFFCRLNIHGMGCLKKFDFPAKKLIKKIRVLKLRMLQFFFIFNLHLIKCGEFFPPKNLEKIRRPKYACANFFFFQSFNKLYLYSFVVFLLSAVSKQARNKVFVFRSISHIQ